MTLAEVSCPVCEAVGATLIQERPRDFEYDVVPATPSRILRCQRCRSEYLFPRPTTLELLAYYPDDYHAYHEDHGVVARGLVEARALLRAKYYVKLLGGRAGRLFDVGTGDCRHFDSLKHACRLECAGVEINPVVAARARERGYNVMTGTLEELDATDHAGRYDIVSMYHVIEHVVDPRLAARKAIELLRPDGHLVGQLPCVDSWEREIFGTSWGGYHYPRHTQCFSRAGLGCCLKEAGFRDIRITSAPHLQSAISVQNLLISRGWRPRRRFGKSWPYSVFLLGVLPFELTAYIASRAGIINFTARR